MPKITVVVPAYNAERTLGTCIESVLNQTFEDYEVILCDDGSKDKTLSIGYSFADKDSRVSVQRLNHGGAGAARNIGMDSASAASEYLYFLDADDYISPDALQRLYDAAVSFDADVVVAKSHYLDDITGNETDISFSVQGVPFNQVLVGPSLPERPFQSFVGWPWDKLFSIRFIREHALRFQTLRSSNDALFVFLALCEAQRIVCLDVDLFAHRTNNAASIEHTRSKSWGNAISAMKALREEILKRNLYDRAWTSFANWVSHFSYWNMATLDGGALTSEVVRAFDEFMYTVRLDSSDYFNSDDRDFAYLCRQDRYGVIKQYIQKRWQDEQKLNHIYAAHSDVDTLILSLQDALGRERDRAEKLSEENKLLLSTIEAIKESHSWKVGNAIVKPMSRIKRFMKQ